MQKNLPFKIGIPLLTGLLSLAFGVTTTMAARYGETCNINVYPYNPAATESVGTEFNRYLNELSQSQCDPRLAFPDDSETGVQYSPQPPRLNDNPVKAGAENMRIPWAEHQHAYFNDKNHAGTQYYYKSFVDRFEITIQPDGVKNLEFNQNTLNNIYCVTPTSDNYRGNASAIHDCDGTVSDLWGGTKVTKRLSGGKIIVTWQFAASSSDHSGRPQIYGNNGVSFTTYNANGSVNKVLNLTDPDNRKLEFAVQFKSANNPEQIWSATTTSHVLLADLAIRKSNYPKNFSKGCVRNDVNHEDSGWCYLEPTARRTVNVESPSGTHKYFWYNIGSVASVWRKPTPTEVPNRCIGLNLTPSSLEPNTPVTFSVQPIFERTPAPNYDFDYRWTATAGSGSGSTTLSSYVFFDANSNGRYNANEGDYMLNNVPLILLNNELDRVVKTTNTTSNGAYKFTNVAPGDYTVRVEPNAVNNRQGIFANAQNVRVTSPSNSRDVYIDKNGTATVLTSLGLHWTSGTRSRIELPGSTNNNSRNEELRPAITEPTLENIVLPGGTVTNPGRGLDTRNMNQDLQNSIFAAAPGATTIVESPNTITAGSANLSPRALHGPHGRFADDSRATDFANPYTDKNNGPAGTIDDRNTFYTGGDAGTLITVQAVDKQGNIVEGCNAELLIPEEPEEERAMCESITLTPNTLNAPGSTDLTATVRFDDGKSYQTQVTWSQTGGALTGAQVQKHSSGFPFTNTYVTTGREGSVTAKVTDIDGALNSPACQRGVTITPEVPLKECKRLDITNPDAQDGTLEIVAGQPFTYTFNVAAQVQGDVNLRYRWSDTANVASTFDGQPEPYLDQNTETTYFNPNPQNGTVVEVIGYDPQSIISPLCRDSVVLATTTQPGDVCRELTLHSSAGSPLQANQASVLTASATTVNNNAVQTLTWTTSAGTLTPLGACVGQPSGQTLTLSANCPVLFSGGPAGTAVSVSSVPLDPNGACLKTLQVVERTVPEEPCGYLELRPAGDNNYCISVNPPNFAGQVQWNFNGNFNTYNNNTCVHLFTTPPNAVLEAVVPEYANQCRDTITFPATPPPPPTVEKDVRRVGGTSYSQVLTLTEGQKMVEYRIRFTPPTGYPTTTTLLDTLTGSGVIQGEYPDLFQRLPGTPNPGRIEYRNNMTVSGIGRCTGDLNEASNCYTGEINTGLQLIKVTTPVTITYQGEIMNSAITEHNCNEGLVCQEIYNNVVRAPYTTYDQNGNEVHESEVTSNTVRVQIFCQYILTRSAGDIFLETDLQQGIDIHRCTPYKSATGMIITPAEEIEHEVVSTGGDQIVQIGHEVCSSGGGSGSLSGIYGDSTNLSSQICEVKLQPGSNWEKTKIIASIDENKTRISRFEPNLTSRTINNVSVLPRSQSGVYHVKGDLTIDNTGTSFIADGDGAKTFIIENGDLIIKDNIKIAPCARGNCTLRQMASMAFIVLNGNIYIEPDVTDIAGVFFVQKGDAGTGFYISGTPNKENDNSDNRLTVLGSMFGDIQPLFKNRKAAGDPGRDQASITVRWDQRVILNTPAGLQDIVDIKQSEVAR